MLNLAFPIFRGSRSTEAQDATPILKPVQDLELPNDLLHALSADSPVETRLKTLKNLKPDVKYAIITLFISREAQSFRVLGIIACKRWVWSCYG